MNSLSYTITPHVLFLSTCSIVFFVCGCRSEEKRESHSADQEPKSELEIAHEFDRKHYLNMFGSIIVPTYPGFSDSDAPRPMVFIVLNKQGDISAIRRLCRGNSRWAYEELESKIIRVGKIDREDVAFVIAADKNLQSDVFLELIKDIGKKSGMKKLWIQAWGQQPYPHQIPIDFSDIDPKKVYGDCHDLQDIVDRLCEAPKR